MLVETLSVFPHMYDSFMGESMMRIAQEKGILQFKAHDLRDWTHDRHRTTDDEPYGGGQGLVMKCGPVFEAMDDLFPARAAADTGVTESTRNVTCGGSGDRAGRDSRDDCDSRGGKPYVIMMAPTGERFDEAMTLELGSYDHLFFICGHYEGFDERVYSLADRVVSIGDYVLTSGELASMVVIDAVVRRLDGVLGDEGSSVDESFYDGLLEYPSYTRPQSFRGMDVPEVLLSGHHAKIAQWRRRQSLERTARLRPDLLATAALDENDRAYLASLQIGLPDD